MTAFKKNTTKTNVTLPPQALPSAGYKGFSQLWYQSTPGDLGCDFK